MAFGKIKTEGANQMNLSHLFEMQKELDERIVKEHGLEGQDLLPMKILALQVELGELANEWRGFKFWSKNQKPRTHAFTGNGTITEEGGFIAEFRNPLLEEYVDCLHFILSIGLSAAITDHLEQENLHEELTNTTEAFQHVFNWAASLDYSRNKGELLFKKAYERLIDVFIALGYLLGFTWKQIEQAYHDKHKVNIERQASGY